MAAPRRSRRHADMVVVDGGVGLEDRVGLEVIPHHHHRAGRLAKIDDQRSVDTEVAAERGPLADPVAGVRQFFRLDRRCRLLRAFLQFAVDVVAGGHRVSIRSAATLDPRRVVSDQEILGAAVGLRHLPVGGNLGVGVGHQMLDGGHRIAVEARDQGLEDGQCICRQIDVVVMHEVELVNRQLGLLAAILVVHPDVKVEATTAAAAGCRHRRRYAQRRQRRGGIEIVLFRALKQLERTAPHEMDRIVRHRLRRRAPRNLHVVGDEVKIVVRPQRRVVVGLMLHQTLIVQDAVAGDILKNFQIAGEVGDDFDKAGRRHGNLPRRRKLSGQTADDCQNR